MEVVACVDFKKQESIWGKKSQMLITEIIIYYILK